MSQQYYAKDEFFTQLLDFGLKFLSATAEVTRLLIRLENRE